jgi:hypothetical protein
MKTFREQNLRVWASEKDGPSVSLNIHVGCSKSILTADEFKRVVSRLIRGLPALLEDLPYSDFGLDNISIKKVKNL